MYYRPMVLITRVRLLIQNVATLLWGKVFYQQSREIPISQNSISQSWHTFIYYLLVSSDREQFFLFVGNWNSYSKSRPLFLVHFSIWLLSFCGSYLYITLVNLLCDTCIADNIFPKTHLLSLVCLRSSFWYIAF